MFTTCWRFSRKQWNIDISIDLFNDSLKGVIPQKLWFKFGIAHRSKKFEAKTHFAKYSRRRISLDQRDKLLYYKASKSSRPFESSLEFNNAALTFPASTIIESSNPWHWWLFWHFSPPPGHLPTQRRQTRQLDRHEEFSWALEKARCGARIHETKTRTNWCLRWLQLGELWRRSRRIIIKTKIQWWRS